MSAGRGPLRDVLVVERAGRLAVGACGHLLAALGARVVRVETDSVSCPNRAIERLMRGGKEILDASPVRVAELLPAADVVLLDPAGMQCDVLADHWQSVLTSKPGRSIVAVISPAGLTSTDLPLDADDALIQAASGLMAVTGENEYAPDYVHAPVAELTGAAVALNAVLAALRVQRRDGVSQLIDVSLVEAMADQLRTHVGLVGAGHTRGFRIGCRHPIAYPWNVYRANDGWVMLCAPSDANWRAMLQKMGRSDLIDDARHAKAGARRRNAEEVDALLQDWMGRRTREAVIDAMTAIDVPAGPALEASQVAADPLLIECGTVQRTADGAVPRLAFRLSRSELTGLSAARPKEAKSADGGWTSLEAGSHRRSEGQRSADSPLAGIRVIELTRYAAGPLAGYLLSSLGAEVIKIEPPGGEDTRAWMPRFGNVSGYFANFNAGKRLVSVDLKAPADRARVEALFADADVVLHNMRPGAMEKLGFGAEALTARHKALVYCAISGYGLHGPKLPALDTVIQARVGLTALTGDGKRPLRVGYSMADQLAGHYAAAGIMAALADRDVTGRGQIVDVAMTDAIAWLTHAAWNGEAAETEPHVRLPAADGWVLASSSADDVSRAVADTRALSRHALIEALAAKRIPAAAVLEVDEVLGQPELRARRSVYEAATDGGAAPVFVAPFGLTATPVRRGERVATVGEDNPAVFGDVAMPAPA